MEVVGSAELRGRDLLRDEVEAGTHRDVHLRGELDGTVHAHRGGVPVLDFQGVQFLVVVPSAGTAELSAETQRPRHVGIGIEHPSARNVFAGDRMIVYPLIICGSALHASSTALTAAVVAFDHTLAGNGIREVDGHVGHPGEPLAPDDGEFVVFLSLIVERVWIERGTGADVDLVEEVGAHACRDVAHVERVGEEVIARVEAELVYELDLLGSLSRGIRIVPDLGLEVVAYAERCGCGPALSGGGIELAGIDIILVFLLRAAGVGVGE